MNKRQWFALPFELIALFVSLLATLGTFVIVRFAEGFFYAYGIPFGIVNFTPQAYDYLRIAVPIGLLSTFTILLLFAAARAGKYIGEKTGDLWLQSSASHKLKHKAESSLNTTHRIRRLGRFIDIASLIIIYGIIITGICVVVYFVSFQSGATTAQSAITYTSLSRESDRYQKLIIYKSSDGILTKIYDRETRTFTNEYEFHTDADFTGRTFTLK